MPWIRRFDRYSLHLHRKGEEPVEISGSEDDEGEVEPESYSNCAEQATQPWPDPTPYLIETSPNDSELEDDIFGWRGEHKVVKGKRVLR